MPSDIKIRHGQTGQCLISLVIIIFIIVTMLITNCDTQGSIEKAKEAWLRNVRNELSRERAHAQNVNKKGEKPVTHGRFFNKKDARISASLARGSMLGAVFSSMRWPELHNGGYLPQELECPTVGSHLIQNTSRGLPMGITQRALKSLPNGFKVTWSRIAGAGMGVFTSTFIRDHTWLAEYEGRLLEWNDNLTRTDSKRRLARLNRIMDYGWVTSKLAAPKYLIDASREGYSNWLRYINMAPSESEQNVVPVQCGDKFFYRTSKPISPGGELLTNYGDNYMLKLGINPEEYYAN